MITRHAISLSVLLFLTPAMPLLSESHPSQVAPRLPQITIPSQQSTPAKEVSNADISAGIKRHINSERRMATDKKFHVNYRGKNLTLDLVRVHDDRLSSLGGGKYFACVDMKGADGTIYDIDFFMAGQPGSMRVTETSVHKINGKPLYDWKEEGGAWKRVRVS